jgi:ribosomal protein S12 methylthiotransferase accessory factor
LASGNCLEEAVAHALCELIERDAWTLAELASQWLPRALRVRALGKLGQAGPDDMERYATLDITTAPPVTRAIAERFHRAGLPLRVRHITSDLGIPTFVAVTAEWVFPAFPQAHFGLGTHPNAEVALVRALVEVAQSRAVDIQAVREDIVLAGDTETQGAIHTRRAATVDTSSWLHNDSSRPVAFSAIPTHLSTDVLDDIRFMMQQLRAHGLTEVIVVDLTPTGAPFSVVRVVVPGLESWGADHGKIGERATTFWCHEQLR